MVTSFGLNVLKIIPLLDLWVQDIELFVVGTIDKNNTFFMFFIKKHCFFYIFNKVYSLREILMGIYIQHKLIVLSPPKTGSSSVHVALRNSYGHHENSKHLTCKQLEKLYPIMWKNFYKIALLRNPVDRIRSVYQHIYSNVEKQKNSYIKGMSLNKFAINACKFRYSKFLLRPQYTYLCDTNGNILVDRIILMDTMDSDWESFREYFGVGIKLGVKNRSTYRDDSEFLPEIEDLIKRTFYLDVAIYEHERSIRGLQN